MGSTSDLTASQEDYLEAIYHISAKKMAARAKDIAERLGVRGSSVTGALRSLGALGLINYAPYDLITLTGEGKVVAEEIVRRHSALERFLVNVLGIDEKEADEAACKMEHAVPKPIIERWPNIQSTSRNVPKEGSAGNRGLATTVSKDVRPKIASAAP